MLPPDDEPELREPPLLPLLTELRDGELLLLLLQLERVGVLVLLLFQLLRVLLLLFQFELLELFQIDGLVCVVPPLLVAVLHDLL